VTGLGRLRHQLKADLWRRRGRVPGAFGFNAAKWLAIENGVRSSRGGEYGWADAGIDERVVEYPWVFDRMAALDRPGERVLDAGSVLNYKRVLQLWRDATRSPVSMVTLAYEGAAHVSNDARYEFADLRQLPYRDAWFSVVLCISTIEHVGLDNTIYGAATDQPGDPDEAAANAMQELHRVSAPGATLLLSVPFGMRSNRGWLRVFDAEDLEQLTTHAAWMHVRSRFFRATPQGWRECVRDDARAAGYNEPLDRPGQRTAPSHVAAAEAVALVEMTRRSRSLPYPAVAPPSRR
jgi:SAM-dependent methyltransferase